MSCGDLVTAVRQSIMSVCGEAFWASFRLCPQPNLMKELFTLISKRQQLQSATSTINLGSNRLSSAIATSFSEAF